jgi:FtsP/CotA-like multicopper oxidase with cupredoxin domain
MRLLQKHLALVFVLACLVFLPERSARAATACLRVDAYQITAGAWGNAASIPMWGFFDCAAASVTTASTASIPTLKATAGDTLTIRLRNNLPPSAAGTVYTEPVSIIIPGQRGTLIPTWTDNTSSLLRATYGQRVRSFTTETPQGTESVYTFSNLSAGTYLIQSGTHPAVQMQMGLYAVLEVTPATTGQAYPSQPSTAFDSEVVLLLSEIDPALHAAVASGSYGPQNAMPPPAMTSTIDYHPKYFLVNGAPYPFGASPASLGRNKKVLLRFLNAGLATKVPLVQGQYVTLVAEDGNLLPAPRQQYNVFLPAGKTMDAILTTPSAAATIPIYDRRLNLTNNGASPGGMGGMFVRLSVP